MSASREDPERVAARLGELLERELEEYRAVLDLARRQSEAIANGATEDLMGILSLKQDRVAAVDALQREAEPLRAALEAAGTTCPEDARAAVEERVEALRGVLAQIVALEEEGRRGLEEARGATGQKLRQLQTGKAMHKAYGKQAPPPSSRIRDTHG
jgi:hypothetical protein